MTQDTPSPEPETTNDEQPSESFKRHVKSRATWQRLFFMLVILMLYAVSRIVVGAVVVLQFFYLLFSGEINGRLQQFGQALATYTYQIILYLTFNSEQRPFPFDADWPAGPPSR
jgi:hypothetical protein